MNAFSKCIANQFGVKDAFGRTIAVGIYFSLSRLPHSCRPNARLTFVGRRVSIVPVDRSEFISVYSKFIYFSKRKPFTSLDDIKHSYIDHVQTIDQRQKQLKVLYLRFSITFSNRDLSFLRNNTTLHVNVKRARTSRRYGTKLLSDVRIVRRRYASTRSNVNR